MAVCILSGEQSAPLTPLQNKVVAVIGYGNQGHAHALNLRDSGIQVVVGSRSEGSSGKLARESHFQCVSIEEAARRADLVVIAVPDEVQPEVFAASIEPNLRPDATLGFLHGFAIRFGLIRPPKGIGAILVAPKGPGTILRHRFVAGQGIPCLMAIHQDSSAGDARAVALAWAQGIGCARAGIIETTFADETETDLFGEQAVLCGGMTGLILAAFEELIRAGYPPEIAYMECCHEVKQIADLVYARGLAGMMKAISNTAEFGAYQAGPFLIDDEIRQRMRNILTNIRNGSFASHMRDEYTAGFAKFNQQRAALASHAIESAGETVRSLMPWLKDELPA
jgi:ketol-acid reductoisomerase